MKLTHQLTIKNLNLKVDHHREGKWFIHGPKHRKEKGESVAKPGTRLLIIISIVCKSHIEEAKCNLSNTFIFFSPWTETS